MPNKICGRERGGVAVAAQARPLWSGLVWSGMVWYGISSNQTRQSWANGRESEGEEDEVRRARTVFIPGGVVG